MKLEKESIDLFKTAFMNGAIILTPLSVARIDITKTTPQTRGLGHLRYIPQSVDLWTIMAAKVVHEVPPPGLYMLKLSFFTEP